MSNRKFYIKQGDRLPPLTGTFVDEATGAPQSLAGATLTFHMRNAGGEVVINQVAELVDASAGAFRYSWQAGDTDVPGVYEGEIQADFSGLTLTSPNRRNFTITITPEIA